MQLIPTKEATDDSTYRVEFVGGMAHIECFGLTVTPIVGLENGEVIVLESKDKLRMTAGASNYFDIFVSILEVL